MNDVAIIGVAVRFPDAPSLDAFRDNLRRGHDSVRPLSPERIRTSGIDPHRDYAELAHLDRVDTFDHRFFGLSRREAEVLDPQHRLALQLAWHAMEDAGHGPASLRGTPTAVILSAPRADYFRLVPRPDTLSLLGNLPAGLPGRVSQVLGLTGPSYAVDTGCNGSLVAVHQACRELADGEAEYALAGGVSLKVLHEPRDAHAHFPEILSPDARCRAFDAFADGTGDGEGGAVLLLTTLERALRDGDHVYAVVKGGAVAHNGPRTGALGTPSPAAQAEVIRRAWLRAGLEPGDAGYLEAHGSGTRLGDAVELRGIALARGQAPGAPLPIGSVKTNIGHLDHAAGIAGLVKALLSVRHGELYPSLHYTAPPQGQDPADHGVEVVTRPRAWTEPDGRPRRAGISSFSLVGSNAHLVIEQAPPPRPAERKGARTHPDAPLAVGVSARNPRTLAEVCERLAAALDTTRPPLADTVLTLTTGRDHHDHRVGLVARTTEELAGALALAALRTRQGQGAGAAAAPARDGVHLLLSRDITVADPVRDVPGPERATDGPAARVVDRQLDAHRRLSGYGVTVTSLLSSGVGRWAARVIDGEATREEADAALAAEDGIGPAPDGDRLRAALDPLFTAERPPVFVALGEDGELARAVAARLAERPGAALVTVGSGPDAVARAVAELYALGVTIDWPRPEGARRTPLPGYPFQEERCWVRPEGEYLRWEELWPGAAPRPEESPAPRSAPATAPTGPFPSPATSADAPVSAGTSVSAGAHASVNVPEPLNAPASVSAVPRADPGTANASGGESVVDRVRRAWTDALHAGEVADGDDYFELGGNSITALEVISALDREFGVTLKLIDLYDHPTLAGLAAFVADRAGLPGTAPERDRPTAPQPAAPYPAQPQPQPHPAGTEPQRPEPPARPDPTGAPTAPPPITRTDARVLSFGQERLWYHQQLEPGSPLYNIPTRVHLHGTLDVEALRGALHDLVERHEIMRAYLPARDGRPELRIAPSLPGLGRFVDVRGEPDPLAAARRLVEEEATAPFDLEHGPLTRALIVTYGPRDHVLCLNVHHAVDDGWSPGILDRELTEFYTARTERRAPRLDPLPVRYTDYAHWQRQWLTGDVLRRELDHWRTALRDAPVLDLPADRPRPRRKDFGGGLHTFTIPGPVAAALRETGRRERATLFMVLLTALDVLLARLTGGRDIVVGSPTAGRDRPETRGLIGFFNNTVALRTRLADGRRFTEVLRETRRVVLDAMEHAEVPFEKVVEAVAPARDLSRNPLFDVVLLHQTIPVIEGRMPGLELSSFEAEDRTIVHNGLAPGTAKFDLTFCVWERDGHDELPVGLEYSTQLFDRETAAAVGDAFLALLRAVAADPEGEALALPLTDEASAAPLYTPPLPGAPDTTLHSLVLDQARRTPDAPAVALDDATLTYRDLDLWSADTAARLAAAGVAPGDIVAVRLPRSAHMVAAALGVLRLGAVHLPLDPRQPDARTAAMLADARPRALITDGAAPPSWTGPVVHLAGRPPRTAEPPVDPAAPGDPAYVIFTSGSTGRPKGVLVEHRGAATLVRATRGEWQLRPGERVLQFAAPTFDAWIWEVFTALAAGAVLCVPDHRTVLVGDDLAAAMTRHRVHTVMLPPSVAASLPQDADPPALRLMVLGGEPVPPELVRRWADRCRVVNAYGPTEATVCVTMGDCVPDGSRPAIGRPLPGTRLWVLDERGRPVPPGVPGELYIGGAQVARGYLGRPELTERRFVTVPGTTERAYRTGDLVRRRSDGSLAFVGRADNQVKHRGYRIELEEIEEALRACGAKDAAVVLDPDTEGGVLRAFAVPGAEPAGGGEELRARLADRLPPYMVPATLTLLPALPLTPHGKADRRRLLALERELAGEGAPAPAGPPAQTPADALEADLLGLFRTVLGRGGIGVHDGFFESGGHSLLAVRLMSRVRELTGRTLPLATLFEHPTVRDLAALLRSGPDPAAPRCLVPIRERGDGEPLFCVHPSGGNVLVYQPLADALAGDRPLWGVQSHGLAEHTEPDRSVAAMAERYLAEIREIQPTGPYHLAGWSFGGAVAYEMGVRLLQAGERVAPVLLLDTDLTATVPRHTDDDAALLAGLLAPFTPPDTARELHARLPGTPLEKAVATARDLGALPPGTGHPEIRRLLRVLRANDAAFAAWEVPDYPGDLTAVRATGGRLTDQGLAALRRRVRGRLTVVEVPGDHFTMLTEHRAALTERLAAHRARERATGEGHGGTDSAGTRTARTVGGGQ
ncbi:amino acid adenylation domain-containing protein [Streptomyces achromogenes]|uniref:amino acid adenylation domain-containing protein n=1 Tax=Streptomyces achromogenes TaxID=67255 RepID=UPI00369A0321